MSENSDYIHGPVGVTQSVTCQRKRIVFMINSLAGGGAERVISTIITHSEEKKDAYEMHLVLIDKEKEIYTPPPFIKVHRLNGRKSLFRSFFHVLNILHKIKPDVVLSFLTRSNFCNVLTKKIIRHRAVISERAHTSGHHKSIFFGRIYRTLVRLIYPYADCVISVSADIRQDLQDNFGVYPEKCLIISNPVNGKSIIEQSSKASPLAIPVPFIVGMGRLVKSKNFSLLIRAFAKSSYQGGLVILGTGPEHENLMNLIKELEIETRVTLVGFVDNPFPIIVKADAYVLPSNGEGFPNGLVEAMVLGRPVISTDCHSGPAEILDDVPYAGVKEIHQAKYGILVPTDAPDEMAEAINIITSPSMRNIWMEKSRVGASRYSLESALERYWQAIEVSK